MNHTLTLVRALLLALAACTELRAADNAAAIPFAEALDRAAVVEPDVSDIAKKGLVVGNGELNAILFSDGNDFHLRLAKNDCWDLRVDTSSDGPMPVIDPTTGKVTGHGAVGSWKKPYPTALPCAEIVLRGDGKLSATNATLDLSRAVATVQTTNECVVARVLAQGNVVLIHSARPLVLSGILDFLREKDLNQWVSRAELGTKDGFSFLHQNIPGDADMSGMDIFVVAGRKDDVQAVAVTTTRDSKHPLDDAVKLVKKSLADSEAVAKHEAIWREFWSQSGIQLGDTELQNWWYRMVYFFRMFSRSDGNAVGLAACFSHLAGWHNSLKLNYNIQQTYLAAAPVNHPELLEPFIDDLRNDLPRAEWFAKTSFVGAEGAFFFSDHYPFEPDPSKCTTPCKHQQTYLPWGYTWGMAGHTAVVLWDYYLYAPDKKHLDRIYPLIKGFGTFYCSMLEKCALENGKRKIGPSFFPELGSFNEYNVCYDISFITAALRIAREAARLKDDTKFLARINAIIDQVPAYGTQPDPDQDGQTVIEQWSGAKFNEGADRHGTMIQGIFPAGIIHWFSDEETKALGRRTINRVEKSTNHANSNVMLNIARARLGLGDEAIANAKMCFSGTSGKYSPEQPNGLFNWSGHGYFITEQVAIARFVTELLVQSVGGVIRIFPAWPKEQDAKFANLRAEGGFLVSAEQKAGKVARLEITSTAGGKLRLLNPWTGQLVERETKAGEQFGLKP